jgi:hypothetical protein
VPQPERGSGGQSLGPRFRGGSGKGAIHRRAGEAERVPIPAKVLPRYRFPRGSGDPGLGAGTRLTGEAPPIRAETLGASSAAVGAAANPWAPASAGEAARVRSPRGGEAERCRSLRRVFPLPISPRKRGPRSWGRNSPHRRSPHSSGDARCFIRRRRSGGQSLGPRFRGGSGQGAIHHGAREADRVRGSKRGGEAVVPGVTDPALKPPPRQGYLPTHGQTSDST